MRLWRFPISFGRPVMMTSGVAWVLHRTGFYSPVSFQQLLKFSDISDLQSPIDAGTAKIMTSGVAWVLQRAGFYLPSSDSQPARISV